jgi:transposase
MYINGIMSAATLKSLIAENTALKFDNTRLSNLLEDVTHQIEWLKRQLFGQKSERMVPAHDGQCSLDIEGLTTITPLATTTQTITYSRKNPDANKTPHGRDEIPAHIPRVTIEIEPDYDATGMEKVGEKITEQLEYIPPKFSVNRYVRAVHATMKNGERTLICVDMPPLCIDKGKLGPTVVAQTILSKCQDHIPHYRTAQMISRDCDMSLPESTIRDAFKQGTFLLDAIVNRLEKIALKSNYLQMDESTIKVMIQPTQGKSHLGYMVVRHAPLEKIILFDYQKTRNVERGKKLLGNFQGTLQSDGLNLYPIICKDLKLTAAGCMDHCRRGFDKALTNDRARATQALDLIRPLYAMEDTAREQSLNAEARLALRKEKSVSVFQAFIAWCNENLKTAPKSPIGKAIIYTLDRKAELGRFLEDGNIEISDIMIENGIRPLAVGRKNFLFAGSEDGARRLAIGYSIIGTCIKNGLNVRKYLNHVLKELPKRMSKNIDDLLPINWKDPDDLK